MPLEYEYNDFELFLMFFNTIEPPIFNDKETCYIYDWAGSLRDKFNAVSILYNEVLYQINMCKNEYEQTKEKGYGSRVQATILLVKYETFLNSIYSFCENISYLVMELYPKASLPRGFNEQKTKHLENLRRFDDNYAKMLASADWYDEVHSMRSEATHYLSGFIFISNTGEPGYLNKKPYSKRGTTQEKIKIENIEKHVKETYNKLYSFVNEFSKHFVELRCNKDKPVAGLCLCGGLTGVRTMTLKDYLLRNPPRCVALEFNCPVEEKCTAVNKPSERKKHI
jgi:hypothetical protein